MNINADKYTLINTIVENKLFHVIDIYSNKILLKELSSKIEKTNFELLNDSPYIPKLCGEDINKLQFEYTDAKSLKTIVEDKFIDNINKFYNIAFELLDAIASIQNKGYVHRSLNYENIIYSQSDNKIYITELNNISKIEELVNINYSFENFSDNINFISPEQTGRINRKVDFKSDYYSLGIIFYYLLSNKLPFHDSDSMAIIHNHISKIQKPINNSIFEIPKELISLITKLLQKEPSLRYSSISGIKNDLLKIKDKKIFNIGEEDYSNKLLLKHHRYGRKDIISKLEYIYKNTLSSNVSFVSIGGYSGVGKTTVVYELHKTISINNGFYSEYKFSLLNKTKAYHGYTQIINNYLNILFSKDTTVLETFKNKLKVLLKHEAKVLTDKISNLKILLGEQEDVEKLNNIEEQNRFYRLFISLVKLISENENSLIFFIDDLQWADSGTINLTKVLLEDKSLNNLFIINAFRSNEIDDEHMYSKFISLIQHDSNVHQFTVKELSLENIKELVEDLIYNEDDVLSDFFFNKSQGNVFYINQMIDLFNSNNLFKYNKNDKVFTYLIDELNEIGLSNDVIEIATRNIESLDTNVVEVLKYLSAISSSFKLQVINIFLYNQNDIGKLLEIALQRNYLIRVKDTYKFSHDKIQESFYQLIHENKKEMIHKEIATILLNTDELSVLYNNINLEISIHLAKAKNILSHEEKFKIVELNLPLAQEFKDSMAYDEAMIHLDIGLSLLNRDDQNLYWNYLFLKLEILYITHKVEEINVIVDKLEDIVNSDEKHVALSKYMFTNNLYTIKYASNLLKKFNVNVPTKVSKLNVSYEVMSFNRCFKNNNFDVLVDLSEMKNEQMLLASETLYHTIIATYLTNKNLFYSYAFKMANISRKHGNNIYSSYAYCLCSLYYSNEKNDFNKAKKLMNTALEINEKYLNKDARARINFINYNNISPYFKSETSRKTDKYLVNDNLLLSGQVYYKNYNDALNTLESLFFSQNNLEILIEDNNKIYNSYVNSKDLSLTKFQSFIMSFTSRLQNYNDYKLMEHYNYNEEKFMIFLDRKMNLLIETISYILKSIELYLFEDYKNAFEHIKSASFGISIQLNNFNESLFMLFYNLIYLEQDKHTIKERILYNKNKKKLTLYSKQVPQRYMMMENLLKACEYSKDKNNSKFDKFYILALDDAQKSNNIFFLALINELAGKSWINLSDKLSNMYLYDSYIAYNKFKATNKANDLSKRYNIQLTRNSDQASDNVQNINNLDLNTIILASQALSKEVKTKDILKNMINIILQNVGATKGFVILNKNDSQIIIAQVDETETKLLENTLISECNKLSINVINYINSTNKPLIINEAFSLNEYQDDSYIQNNKVKSIIAMPIIKNGEQKGVLYCENNLISGVFTSKLLQTVSILLSQLIISLDNAFVYENLENLVTSRTDELNEINTQTKSSIEYAALIQRSLMSSKDILDSYFDDYFLLWQPKDIVSGDIYIINQLRNKNECLIMLIDCTGHGVPGGFVTMLVKAIERQIMAKINASNDTISTSYILQEFNREMKNILDKKDIEKRTNSGFDAGIIYYNKESNIIKYSGANTPLFYIKDDELLIQKGNRYSIGYQKSNANYVFEETIIEVNKGMSFYLSTDGFFDQNGGHKDFPFGKKRFTNEIMNNYKKSFNEQELLFMDNLKNYQGHSIRNDDITFLGFRV